MKNLILGIFAVCLILSAIPLTNAQTEDVELGIKVTYFANYLNGDITDQIFVGNDNDPIGREDVMISLTENGQAIIDDFGASSDVRGLHILRGQDSLGPFFDITAYGHNGAESRESIKFHATLFNSHIIEFVVQGNERGGYNNPFENGCGITENGEQNAENDMPTNDDVEQTSNRRIKLCSTTSNNSDSIRIYYELPQSSDLIISNIVTDPSLPLRTEAEAVDIDVDFDSNIFPLNVGFELLLGSDVVDTQSSTRVENEGDLPVTYFLPGNLNDGSYSLFMIVSDDLGNEVRINLGAIIVDEDGDSDRRNPRNGPLTYESVRHETLSAPQFIQLEEESAILTKPKAEFNWLWIWIIILLALIIILIVLAIIAALR